MSLKYLLVSHKRRRYKIIWCQFRSVDQRQSQTYRQNVTQLIITVSRLTGKPRHSLAHVTATIQHIYTMSQKNQDTELLPITSPNINRFSKFFHSVENLQQSHI